MWVGMGVRINLQAPHSSHSVAKYTYTSAPKYDPIPRARYRNVSLIHRLLQWSFLTFFFLFELGSLLCATAQNSVMLIVGRAIAGLGASGLLNGGLTIVSACLPVHKQPAATGILISFTQLGIALGPLLGGVFTEYVSWRWCKLPPLPVCV